MSKTVYQITPQGYFAGPIEADESPLEPGVYLIPAGCIEEAPPAPGANQWPAWDGSSWATVPDFRGVTAYDPATGESVTVTELGKTLAELGLSADPVADPRVAQAAGAARLTRIEARKQTQAQRLARRGDALGALKLLNNL